MSRQSKLRSRTCADYICRLQLMNLEDRLPPGDALHAGMGLGLGAAAAFRWADSDSDNEAARIAVISGPADDETLLGSTESLGVRDGAAAEYAVTMASDSASKTEEPKASAFTFDMGTPADAGLFTIPGFETTDQRQTASPRDAGSLRMEARTGLGEGNAIAGPSQGGSTGSPGGVFGGLPDDAGGNSVPYFPGQGDSGSGDRNITTFGNPGSVSPIPVGFDVGGADCIAGWDDIIEVAPGGGPGETPSVTLPSQDDGSNCEAADTHMGTSNPNAGSGVGMVNYSEAPIRYHDGTLKLSFSDLESSGFGQPWGHVRSWTNNSGYAASSAWNGNGLGAIVHQMPYLLSPAANSFYAITNGTNARPFKCPTTCSHYDPPSTTWMKEYMKDLTENSVPYYKVFDTAGNQLYFNKSGTNALQFYKHVDKYGVVTKVESYSGTKITEVRRTVGDHTESYLYSYLSSGTNSGELQTVTMRRKVGEGDWETVRKVSYAYYDRAEGQEEEDDDSGINKNLKFAVIKDANDNVLDTKYYRYWIEEEELGYEGALKFAFEPASYARLVAWMEAETEHSDVDDLTDEEVAPFADFYFEYDDSQRVVKEIAQTKGSSRPQTFGLGTFTFSYADNPNNSPAPDEEDHNEWFVKTVEVLPDHDNDNIGQDYVSRNLVYTNAFGEVILKVYEGGPEGYEKQYPTYYRRDAQGRVIFTAHPSVFTEYSDAYYSESVNDLIGFDGDSPYLANSAGLVITQGYTTGSSSYPEGYFEYSAAQQGETGTDTVLVALDYTEHENGTHSIFPITSVTRYGGEGMTGGRTTTYSYPDWISDTHGIEAMTTTYPEIGSGQNGPDDSSEVTVVRDALGQRQWLLYGADDDPGRVIQYFQHDIPTGAITLAVNDVDTEEVSFEPETEIPDGWETAGGRGLHVIYKREVDELGRETRFELESKDVSSGNVTYTKYDDPNHEIRIYPGWTGSAATGPTTVIREDRDSNPSYQEILTMSAEPDVTGDLPDGTEDIDAVQSLTRIFTGQGGQITHVDVYHGLNGEAYSETAEIDGALFDTWTYGYDAHGRPNRVQTPTGTVYLTQFDGLGRRTNESVGTSSNNAEIVREYEYDGGDEYDANIGDGTLTKIIEYPGTKDSPSDKRVTKLYYDWRNRVIATKSGVEDDESEEDVEFNRPLFVYAWNNLGELLMAEQYDGDTVEEAPIPESADCARDPEEEDYYDLRRACVSLEYDDWGRVFAERIYTVDQSTGVTPASDNRLTSQYWYDLRGNVIKMSVPGGQVYKTQFDGMNRPVKEFVSDGGGDSTWAHAGTVTGDNVLEQTATEYDINNNPVFTTHKARFHDEDDTGELGDADSAPYARVSYVASYYDAANRLTDTVDVGTYGGTEYTRESPAPSRSDTKLRTSYGYKADEVQVITKVGTPSSNNFKLSFDGGSSWTSDISDTASASTVRSELTGLGGIGAGNVMVTGPTGGPWIVRFISGLAEEDQPLITSDDANVVIAATSEGGDGGRLQKIEDPRGIIAKTDYDLKGRSVRKIEKYDNFSPADIDDRTTEFAYDGSDHLTMFTAVLPSNAYQKTQYVYGVDPGTYGSAIYSNDLLRQVKYPDKSTGSPSSSSSDHELYKYNALDEVKEFTDRNATVHAYSFDIVGRFTADAATLAYGSTVDNAILMQTVDYDTAGRAFKFTNWNATSSGSVVNEVQYAFNGLGQLITDYQEHDDDVDTGSSPKVQYGYNALDDDLNRSRLEKVTYPNGRNLHYVYASGLDSNVSRLSSLADDSSGSPGAPLEEYSYLGLMTPVKRARPEPDVDLTYIAQGGDDPIEVEDHDPGDQYTGLDRFGRVRDQRWRDTGSGDPTDRFVYGYDRNSNRLYKDNLIEDDFDELYHADGEAAGYDGFDQLTAFQRGPLSDSGSDDIPDTVSSASRYQTWTLDVMGNWDYFDNNSVTDDRTHNKQNQLTGGTPSASYDNNGNTTQFTESATARKYVYDAWNRLVRVTNTTGDVTHVSYEHDAIGRRIESTAGGTTTDLYYSSNWQVLEEKISGTTKSQYVWSPLYVDALVLRDRDANNTGGDGLASSGLEERLYVQQDANWNVTALVDTDGDVVERFVYNPYGSVTRLTDQWGNPGGDTYGWVYLHQGGRYDSNSKLYHFRMRDYSPSLGRWMQNDPLGYGAGDTNLYRYIGNNPASGTDPLGLQEPPKNQNDWKQQLIGNYFKQLDKLNSDADALVQKINGIIGDINKLIEKMNDDIANNDCPSLNNDYKGLNTMLMNLWGAVSQLQGIMDKATSIGNQIIALGGDPNSVIKALRPILENVQGVQGDLQDLGNAIDNVIADGKAAFPFQFTPWPGQSFTMNFNSFAQAVESFFNYLNKLYNKYNK